MINLEKFNILSNHEMKQVVGGYIAACMADCDDGSTITCAGDACSTGTENGVKYCSYGDHGDPVWKKKKCGVA